jgi:hypothetical protein
MGIGNRGDARWDDVLFGWKGVVWNATTGFSVKWAGA